MIPLLRFPYSNDQEAYTYNITQTNFRPTIVIIIWHDLLTRCVQRIW